MQELRLVAVSEDGSYLVLATAGRGTRFTLPVDDRLRAAVRGHFSRLGQFEIEVESPLRPKEIQARIRAGETAEQIAESAGIPVERVRWFEGPVLQEREYMAQQAQRVAVRRQGESRPGLPLGEMVEERLGRRGIDLEGVEWDSRKCEDNTWRVRLSFFDGGRPYVAEWSFDPRRRHVSPLDEDAARLSSLVLDESATDTVTPLMPRRPTMKVVSDSRGGPPEQRQDQARREYTVERGRIAEPPEPITPPRREPVGPPIEDPLENESMAQARRNRPAEPRERYVEPPKERAPEPVEETVARLTQAPHPPHAGRDASAWPQKEHADTRVAQIPVQAPVAEEPPAAEPKAPAQQPAARRQQHEPTSEPVREPTHEPAREGGDPRPRKAAEPHRAEPGKQVVEPGTVDSREEVAKPRRPEPRKGVAAVRRQEPAEREPDQAAKDSAAQANDPAAVHGGEAPVSAPVAPPARPRRKPARGKRTSVPSWDEIMFGARRPD